MYRLYYSPGACSLVIHALLHSLDVPFDIILTDLNKAQNTQPGYIALNPRGQVPVLVEDGKILRESAAISLYLLQKHGSPLLPEQGWPQAKALEWLGFYNSTLQQAYGAYFLMSHRLKDDAAKEAACTLAAKRITVLWREVEAHLEKNTYLCGDSLTIADLYHAVIANWSSVIPHSIVLGPHIVRLCKQVYSLPYFQKALHAENVKYKLGN